MSSSYTLTPCQRCDYPFAFFYYECKEIEDWLYCPACGLDYTHVGILNPAQDRKSDYKLTQNGQVVTRSVEVAGYGSVITIFTNGEHQFRKFRRLPTSTAIQREIHRLQNNTAIDPTNSLITRWDPATKRVEVLFGRLPQSEDEAFALFFENGPWIGYRPLESDPPDPEEV